MKNIFSWITITRLTIVSAWLAAILMAQTLYFKFSGDEESMYIFKTLSELVFASESYEPHLRWGTGVLELISIFLLIRGDKFRLYGALLGSGLMLGAVLFHAIKLGVSVQGDGGQLFAYSLVTLLCCLALIACQRHRLKILFNRYTQ